MARVLEELADELRLDRAVEDVVGYDGEDLVVAGAQKPDRSPPAGIGLRGRDAQRITSMSTSWTTLVATSTRRTSRPTSMIS